MRAGASGAIPAPGQLVRSIAGHDRGKVYMAIGITERGVLLCDGRARTIDRPKCKNSRHIVKVSMNAYVWDPEMTLTDMAVRKVIREFHKYEENEKKQQFLNQEE